MVTIWPFETVLADIVAWGPGPCSSCSLPPASLPAGLSRKGTQKVPGGDDTAAHSVVALVPCPSLGAGAWGVARTQK